MSETDLIQRLTLSGLGAALLALSAWPGSGDAHATQLFSSSSPANGIMLAQVRQPEGNAQGSSEVEAGGDGQAGDDIQARDAGQGADVPFSELNEALSTARSRLTELTKAAEIAKVASGLREQLQAVEAENRQLKTVLGQLQTENSELLSGKQDTDSRLIELERQSNQASDEATRLDQALASARLDNERLRGELAKAETAAGEAAERVDAMRADMEARTVSLTAAAEESAARIARLQSELDAAERERNESSAALAELRTKTEDQATANAKLAGDLDRTITELADSRSSREQLQQRLDSAEADLGTMRTVNAGLQQQVDVLKTAAGEATDAARQNLLAVESRINEINAALASVTAEALPENDGTSASVAPSSAVPFAGAVAGTPSAGDDRGAIAADASPETADALPLYPAIDEFWVPRPSPPRGAGQTSLAAASEAVQPAGNPVVQAVTASAEAEAGPPADVIGRFLIEDLTEPQTAEPELASLATELPADRRQDALALLDELKAENDQRGLSMTVPGEQLFAVDGEEIEPAALDILADVAELVSLYDKRDVLIVGHTDAVGDAGYNQRLSERRAALVKTFFVENFEIESERLQIEGKGEQDPISTNATADGRNANRRVEVIILN